MLFRKTEKYYTEYFRIWRSDKDKKGDRRIKKTTYWILFLPIVSISTVVEQKDYPRVGL